ncbi:hypothetical protein [Nocardioides sp. TF02-7]|uniref:hypothetical protein n=1 Tax=Nocardioides sp. TF02-7 TaxID=2917724 RepID=UPI001F06C1AE|nr:hypothetical protein [Nocardioides sp. TF02-7]UMG93206.1 hypothetical protein MF408_02565 [Nocardioides sp. TF02-7]
MPAGGASTATSPSWCRPPPDRAGWVDPDQVEPADEVAAAAEAIARLLEERLAAEATHEVTLRSAVRRLGGRARSRVARLAGRRA